VSEFLAKKVEQNRRSICWGFGEHMKADEVDQLIAALRSQGGKAPSSDLRQDICNAIFRNVKASTHPVFVDRLTVSGIDAAAEAIIALLPSPPEHEGVRQNAVVVCLQRMATLWHHQPRVPLDPYQDGYNAGLRVAAMHAKQALDDASLPREEQHNGS
jgi:hypothetical protein